MVIIMEMKIDGATRLVLENRFKPLMSDELSDKVIGIIEDVLIISKEFREDG
jgi:hypothetical protein